MAILGFAIVVTALLGFSLVIWWTLAADARDARADARAAWRAADEQRAAAYAAQADVLAANARAWRFEQQAKAVEGEVKVLRAWLNTTTPRDGTTPRGVPRLPGTTLDGAEPTKIGVGPRAPARQGVTAPAPSVGAALPTPPPPSPARAS